MYQSNNHWSRKHLKSEDLCSVFIYIGVGTKVEEHVDLKALNARLDHFNKFIIFLLFPNVFNCFKYVKYVGKH